MPIRCSSRRAAVLPPARSLFFAPLKETVPVFEGRVSLLRDATQRYRAVLPSLSRGGTR